jgi:hypothetical protein
MDQWTPDEVDAHVQFMRDLTCAISADFSVKVVPG